MFVCSNSEKDKSDIDYDDFFSRSFRGVLASLKENIQCTIVHRTEYIIDRSVHGQLTEKFAKQDLNYCPLLWFV